MVLICIVLMSEVELLSICLLVFRTPYFGAGLVVHTINRNTGEAEIDGSL